MQVVSQPTRISKLVRLLASPVDGEVIATCRALSRVLSDSKSDFHALADVIERHWTPPVVAFNDPGKPWQQFAADLLKYPEVLLGSRELDFLRNMRRSRFAPTAGQEKWMRDINSRRQAA